MNDEPSSIISEPSADPATSQTQLPGWIKVTAIATASALVGGLAAAWFYRKIVSRLQNAVEMQENSNFSMTEMSRPEHIEPGNSGQPDISDGSAPPGKPPKA